VQNRWRRSRQRRASHEVVRDLVGIVLLSRCPLQDNGQLERCFAYAKTTAISLYLMYSHVVSTDVSDVCSWQTSGWLVFGSGGLVFVPSVISLHVSYDVIITV